MRTALVVVHAASGSTALVAATVLLHDPREARRRAQLRASHVWGILVLAGTTVAIVAWDWTSLSTGGRIAFAALTLLAFAMAAQALRGHRLLTRGDDDSLRRSVDAIGFTAVSLLDGFVIVTALDLGAPAWLVAAAGLAGVVAGRRFVHGAQASLRATSPSDRATRAPSGPRRP